MKKSTSHFKEYSSEEWQKLPFEIKRDIWNHYWNPYKPDIGKSTRDAILENFKRSYPELIEKAIGFGYFGWDGSGCCQMLALLGMPLVVLFLFLAPLVWDQPSPDTVFIALIIGFAPLAYIAVSSIRNRVSIGPGSLPIKGARAVWSGVATLVFIILVVTGYVLYFALEYGITLRLLDSSIRDVLRRFALWQKDGRGRQG